MKIKGFEQIKISVYINELNLRLRLFSMESYQNNIDSKIPNGTGNEKQRKKIA